LEEGEADAVKATFDPFTNALGYIRFVIPSGRTAGKADSSVLEYNFIPLPNTGSINILFNISLRVPTIIPSIQLNITFKLYLFHSKTLPNYFLFLQ